MEHNDIEIQVTFEIDRRTLPLSVLETLAPGYTFPLTEVGQNPVTVRANGKPVAKGRIVDINGTLGVQLVEAIGQDA